MTIDERQFLLTVAWMFMRHGQPSRALAVCEALVEDDPRSGRTVPREVRYDRNTRLFHQGRELAVEGLERGDVVSIEVVESGRDAWARSIEVVRDVREAPGGYDRGYGGGYDGRGGGYGRDGGFDPGVADADLRGAVSYVDARARLIRIDSGGVGGTAAVPAGTTCSSIVLPVSPSKNVKCRPRVMVKLFESMP